MTDAEGQPATSAGRELHEWHQLATRHPNEVADALALILAIETQAQRTAPGLREADVERVADALFRAMKYTGEPNAAACLDWARAALAGPASTAQAGLMVEAEYLRHLDDAARQSLAGLPVIASKGRQRLRDIIDAHDAIALAAQPGTRA